MSRLQHKIHLASRCCWNCDAFVLWGVFCLDCVRAMALGAAGAIGSAVAAWLWL